MNVLRNPPTITNAITPRGSSIVAAFTFMPVSAEIEALPPRSRIAETQSEQNRA